MPSQKTSIWQYFQADLNFTDGLELCNFQGQDNEVSLKGINPKIMSQVLN